MKEGMYAQRPLEKIHIGAIFHTRNICYKNLYFIRTENRG